MDYSTYSVNSTNENNTLGVSSGEVKEKKLQWYYAPAFLAFWLTIYLALVIPLNNSTPTPLALVDETDHSDSFNSERAERVLLNLTSIGPRVVGSDANSVVSVEFLLSEIKKINAKADSSYSVEVDVQVASGNFIHWSMVNMYQGITNVIVKISNRDSIGNNYLLLNSHFDTVTTSPGGGDDGVMVSAMLEVMRVLTKKARPLKYPVVFLFNGAEENPMQGSHAFITQHKWASNCKVVINLDSTGSAGREIAFRSTKEHSWIMKYYAKAPYPLTTVLVGDLFDLGLVPSDTDFSIFQDYGNLPGVDLAFVYNGYVYHTQFDKGSVVRRSSLQNVGDNLLNMVQSISNAPEMENPKDHFEDEAVFYSFFHFFLIIYTKTIAIIIDVVICIVAIAAIFTSLHLMNKHSGLNRKQLLYIFAMIFSIQVASIVFGALLSILVASVMDAFDRSQSWFSQLWLVIMLYVCPMIFGMGILPTLYIKNCKHSLGLEFIIQMFLHSHSILLIIFILVLLGFGLHFTYIFTIPVLFDALSLIINILTKWHRNSRKFLVTISICQIIPFLYSLSAAQFIVQTYVPMTGRTGTEQNPEYIMAGVAIIFSIISSGFLIPLLLLFRKTATIMGCFFLTCIIFIIFAVTPAGFPFTPTTAPQVFTFIHTHRIFHNQDKTIRLEDTGVYFFPNNRRSHTADDHIATLGEKIPIIDTCSEEMLCGVPHYNHRFHAARENNFWIPIEEKPNLPSERAQIVLTEQSIELRPHSTPFKRHKFTLKGPDHMTLFIQPLYEGTIVNWSFNLTMLRDKWEPPYFIYYSYGNDATPLEFFIDVEKPSANFTAASFEIGIGSHWVHQSITRTPNYESFVKNFPSFGTVIDWVSTYETWIF